MASSRSYFMSSLGLDEMERNALIQNINKKRKKRKKIVLVRDYEKLTTGELFNTRAIKLSGTLCLVT